MIPIMSKNSYESFTGVSCVADELAHKITSHNSIEDYFDNISSKFRNDDNFLVNKAQLLELTYLVACPGDIEIDSYDDFLMGSIVAYDALGMLEPQPTYQQIYTALSDLYSHAHISIHAIEHNNDAELSYGARQTMIGLYIEFLMDKDMAFSTISSDENHVVSEMAKFMGKTEDESYDFVRGYQMVRSVLTWHEKYLNERERMYGMQKNEDMKDFVNFYEIIGQINVDANLVDGNEDITKDMILLNRYFENYRREVYQSEIYKTQKTDDLQDFLCDKMSDHFFTMQNVIVLDTIKIRNQGIAMIFNEDNKFTGIIPIYGNFEIHGKIVDYDVMPVPSLDWYNELFDTSTDYVNPNIPLEAFGLVLCLDDVSVVDNGQAIDAVDPSSSIYIPIGYPDISIYKTFVPRPVEE